MVNESVFECLSEASTSHLREVEWSIELVWIVHKEGPEKGMKVLSRERKTSLMR